MERWKMQQLTCDDNTELGSRISNQRRSLLRKDCKIINVLIYLSLIFSLRQIKQNVIFTEYAKYLSIALPVL